MSDPLQTDPVQPGTPSEADRDAKIEQLLLTGLDHYFASEFEQAINVWTRALFLDRNHARARAYIERARSALAERQRESEELLQNGLAAFTRGAGGEARRLLQDALSHGAPRDEALAVLDRLNRLENGAQRPPASRAARTQSMPPTAIAPVRRVTVVLSGTLMVLAVGLALVLLAPSRLDWSLLLGLRPTPPQPTASAAPDETRFPVPLRGERALARARILVAGGALHDALVALDAVKSTDTEKPEADTLRATIQRQLIAIADLPRRPGADKSSPPLP